MTSQMPIVAYCTGCGQGYITHGKSSAPVCPCGYPIQPLEKPMPQENWEQFAHRVAPTATPLPGMGL